MFASPPAVTSPCKILKCNSEFWAATSGSHHLGTEEAPEFCTALRAYAHCTRRTARTCRGDLAYHSAVHGIDDLMVQHNCSKDGPTSQPRLRTLPPGDSQERSDSPEICHYEKSFHKHSAAPNYTHCGLFGDPHLRTFTDTFQTCKVQGAWPLIDNNYLNVQVTNTPVLPGSTATATSKVSLRHVPVRRGGQGQRCFRTAFLSTIFLLHHLHISLGRVRLGGSSSEFDCLPLNVRHLSFLSLHLHLMACGFFLSTSSPIKLSRLRCCSSEGHHGQGGGLQIKRGPTWGTPRCCEQSDQE